GPCFHNFPLWLGYCPPRLLGTCEDASYFLKRNPGLKPATTVRDFFGNAFVQISAPYCRLGCIPAHRTAGARIIRIEILMEWFCLFAPSPASDGAQAMARPPVSRGNY